MRGDRGAEEGGGEAGNGVWDWAGVSYCVLGAAVGWEIFAHRLAQADASAGGGAASADGGAEQPAFFYVAVYADSVFCEHDRAGAFSAIQLLHWRGGWRLSGSGGFVAIVLALYHAGACADALVAEYVDADNARGVIFYEAVGGAVAAGIALGLKWCVPPARPARRVILNRGGEVDLLVIVNVSFPLASANLNPYSYHHGPADFTRRLARDRQIKRPMVASA